MKRLYGYIRVSTAKQGQHGVSLQEQRDAIMRYAEKRDFQMVEWYEERQTAAKRGRPVFAAMMKNLRKAKADGVVIHKIDRSARNLRDWADIGELIDAGVDVHFANEPLDLRSRGGRLSADILAVVAADFIRNNREETRKGFYGRLKQGIYPLNAPLGYLDQGGGKAKAIDPDRAALLRYAFERYATGEVSLSMLLDELWRKGLRNKRGNRLTMTGIATILRNPFYTGTIRLRNGETFVGIHNPLIRPTVFARVQDVLAGKKPRRVQVHEHRYRRLFACGTCGRSLIASRAKGRVYYRCQVRSCPTTSIREDSLDESVHSALTSITLPEERIAQLEDEVRAAFASAKGLIDTERARLSGALGAVAERLSRLTDALIDGRIDKPSHDERRRDLLGERATLQDSLSNLAADYAIAEHAILRCLQLARNPVRVYELATAAEKRVMVETVTYNRIANGKKVEFATAEPFSFLPGARENLSCAPNGGKRTTLSTIAAQLVHWSTTKKEELQRLSAMLAENEDNELEALAA